MLLLRRLLAVLAALVVVGTLAFVTDGSPARASGSGDLMPTDVRCEVDTACRLSIEWRTSTYGPSGAGDTPLRRRTMLSVYAEAGEQILTGSSSLDDAGTADVVIWNPGVVPDPEAAALPAVTSINGFSCSAQRTAMGDMTRGVITYRSQEVAGARSADGTGNPAGYLPCVYTAPTTGIYRVAFHGTAGGNSDAQQRQAREIGTVTPRSTFTPLQTGPATAVMAWDVTVRAAGPSNATDLPGRVFTYSLAGFSGLNGLPVDVALNMTTPDGFRYVVDTNGFDPSGFLLYANDTGFLDADGTPLHHDVVSSSADLEKMASLVGGTHLGRPAFPLSLEPLAAETMTALGIPFAPVAPTLDGLTFAGQTAANESYVARGGGFTFTTATPGPYQIVISRDGTDFDPAGPANRVLRGTVGVGTHTVAWDGSDNSGAAFPAGQDYAVRAFQRTGEYHVSMLDVESSLRGGPSILLTNPPGGTCPLSGVMSTGTNCSRAFYDDRGYVTSSGVLVGTADGRLADTTNGTQPGVLFSDGFSGFDSTSTQRAFGTSSSSAGGTFGDVKGLDTWTYVHSPVRTTTVDVVALPAAPVAGDDAVETRAGQTLTLPGSELLGDDTGSGLHVTGSTAATHGTATVDADGALTYVPAAGSSGTDTFTYTVTDDLGRTDTATVTVTVRPDAVDDTGTTPADTALTVSAAAGLLANDTGTGLEVTDADDPAHGTLTVDADGGFTYTPDPGFVGSDEVAYTVTDASGVTGTARLSLTVTGGGVGGGALDDEATGVVGEPETVDVLHNDAPPSGRSWDRASLGLVDPGTGSPVRELPVPGKGTWRVTADDEVSFTPVAGLVGTVAIDYVVEDSTGATATATVSVFFPRLLAPPPVDPEPPAPTATPAPAEPTPSTAAPPTPAPAAPRVDAALPASPATPADPTPERDAVRPTEALAPPTVAPALPAEPTSSAAPTSPPAPTAAAAPTSSSGRGGSGASGAPAAAPEAVPADGGAESSLFTVSGTSVAVGLLSVGTAVGLALLAWAWVRRRRGEP